MGTISLSTPAAASTGRPSAPLSPLRFSRNGRKIQLVSFPPGTPGHGGRMPGLRIRWIDAPGESLRRRTPETLLTISGGQGTMNVNSWSADSTRFVYVRLVREQ